MLLCRFWTADAWYGDSFVEHPHIVLAYLHRPHVFLYQICTKAAYSRTFILSFLSIFILFHHFDCRFILLCTGNHILYIHTFWNCSCVLLDLHFISSLPLVTFFVLPPYPSILDFHKYFFADQNLASYDFTLNLCCTRIVLILVLYNSPTFLRNRFVVLSN